VNISEHTGHFIQEMKRRNFSENTIRNYMSCLKIFFEKSKKDHPKNINEYDIKLFLSNYTEPNTQRNYHSAIKKFYDVCLSQKNKFKYIPYARKNERLPIVLSVDEIQKMFSVCENLKHKVILSLIYSAGLRASELINLKWCNIDRSRMVINIIAAKGNKDRQVVLTTNIIPLLERYWHEYKSKEYVLNGQKSIRYSKRSVLEVVKELGIKAGLHKRVWTHLIRHCTGTHLVENGTDINVIQKLLGHNNVKTTLIYTHISHTIISRINSPLSAIAI